MKKKKETHLYRGAPCVRVWSKHQQIDKNWTLCGIPEQKTPRLTSTEDETQVTCRFCRDLAGLKPYSLTRVTRKAQLEAAA